MLGISTFQARVCYQGIMQLVMDLKWVTCIVLTEGKRGSASYL